MSASLPPDSSGYQRLTRRRWLWWGGAALVAGAGAAGLSRNYWMPLLAGEQEEDLLHVCVVAPPYPYDPASGLPIEAPRAIPKDARCPVCGMYPERSPAWAAQVIYRDGGVHYFDSPIDLMQFLNNVPGFSPGDTRADILSAWVRYGRTGQWLPHDKAWYVHGSDALGPMRMGDLPAFPTREAAQEFAGRRGGKVLSFEGVTPSILKSLSSDRSHAMHEHM